MGLHSEYVVLTILFCVVGNGFKYDTAYDIDNRH